ncbi:STAS domain-containing protein [Victivallis sp. Marseille-Q1083]|uniref:STAS domain-containing protein n=1 Tax=Victivallis sp. Marseille-Q1083 TaxID=2717288 RepID=UPI00158DDAB2|nr:STAS domain-containing protein [Victivallis sp. Marseille-Q1083]
MEIHVVDRGENYALVTLNGSLDIAGVQKIEMDFLNEVNGKRNLVLDLSKVTFIASLGMRMILGGAKKMVHNQCKLVLLHPQPLVENALEVAGLKSIIEIVDDLDTALALVK